MGNGRTWTPDEVDFLINEMGNKSIPAIAKILNRTPTSIINKIHRLKLGSFIDNSSYITLNTLIEMFKADYDTWVKNGVPTIRKKRRKCSIKFVDIKKFWVWADNHRAIISFKNVDKNALGKEPDWVDKARRVELRSPEKSARWTDQEISLLKALCKAKKYTCKDIAEHLNRTENAIKRKIYDLYLEDCIKKLDNHIKYTDDDINTIKTMILQGCTYKDISRVINKSHRGIGGYMYRVYGTQKLDILRQIIKE